MTDKEFGHQAGCSPLPLPNSKCSQLYPNHNGKFGRLLKLLNIIRFWMVKNKHYN